MLHSGFKGHEGESPGHRSTQMFTLLLGQCDNGFLRLQHLLLLHVDDWPSTAIKELLRL